MRVRSIENWRGTWYNMSVGGSIQYIVMEENDV